MLAAIPLPPHPTPPRHSPHLADDVNVVEVVNVSQLCRRDHVAYVDDVLVVEAAEELDLAQDALRVDLVLEGLGDLREERERGKRLRGLKGSTKSKHVTATEVSRRTGSLSLVAFAPPPFTPLTFLTATFELSLASSADMTTPYAPDPMDLMKL